AAVLIESDLPDGQGAEVVRFVKRELSRGELPVVLMSASDGTPDAADLANGVLHKPFSPEQLVAAVRSACGTSLSSSQGQPSWAAGQAPFDVDSGPLPALYPPPDF